jgi:hypothetical protein
MDPLTMWLLIGTLGSQVAGSAMNAHAAGQANAMTAAQFEENRADSMQQAMANFLSGEKSQRNAQSMQGLASTQMDPYSQVKSLNNADIKRQFAAGYTPGQGFQGQFSTPALSPESLAGARTQFDKYAAAAQPNVPVQSPDAETFRTQYQAQQSALNQQIMAYLKKIGAPTGQNYGDVDTPGGI